MHCMKTLPMIYKCILDLLFTTSNLNQYRPQHGQSVIFLIWTAWEKKKSMYMERTAKVNAFEQGMLGGCSGGNFYCNFHFHSCVLRVWPEELPVHPATVLGGWPKPITLLELLRFIPAICWFICEAYTSLISTGAEKQHTISQKAVMPPKLATRLNYIFLTLIFLIKYWLKISFWTFFKGPACREPVSAQVIIIIHRLAGCSTWCLWQAYKHSAGEFTEHVTTKSDVFQLVPAWSFKANQQNVGNCNKETPKQVA